MRSARVLVTGSTQGLGLLAAELLARDGHAVTLHARSAARAADARRALPAAAGVLVGDLETLAGMRAVAEQAKAAGPFDAVIHNAAVGDEEPRHETPDGLEHVFAVNVLSPYLLTASLPPPKRLVYLGSGLHQGGRDQLDDPLWKRRRWSGTQAYSDSKLYDIVLAFAIARRWPRVVSNAVDPGWVPTRMGGPRAPDDLTLGAVTQAWLAVSDDAGAMVTGRYLFHQELQDVHAAAKNVRFQDELLAYCASLTGVPLPEGA
ncbi:MAG TPA: SDR family NAD(P)-dependent oxidoreductase [Polyangiaceae bacterium]|jgi:NAD(P)-dependent dehydrogenase (short-subunit alcohol dehydrogenase family)